MMNYLQQNISKLQAGGMPTMSVDPQMLAQMMSEQGAGQGVDYNGEPTPNISGEPSFADMAQEIQERYDKLIIPLQKRLDKLKAKLKENPTDQTIKNEIRRLEERIDQLEQQEDMELQQLEAEVEKSGEIIDQQKQMEGYGDMQGEVPEEDVVAQQSPEMMEQMQGGIPMMQKGGIVKAQSLGEFFNAAKNKTKEYIGRFGIQLEHAKDNWKSWTDGYDNTLKQGLQKVHNEMDQLEETNPGIALAMNFINPAYSFMDWEKNLQKDIAEKNKAGIGLGLTIGALSLLGGGGFVNAIKKGKKLPALEFTTKKIDDLTREEEKLFYKNKTGRGLEHLKNFGKGAGKVALSPIDLAARAAFNTFSDWGSFIHNFGGKYGAKTVPKISYKKPFSTFGWEKNDLIKNRYLGKNITTRVGKGIGYGVGSAIFPLVLGESVDFINNYFNNKDIINEQNKNAVQETVGDGEEILYVKPQTGGIIKKQDGDVTPVPSSVKDEEDKKKQEEINKWYSDFTQKVLAENPTGIKGYFKNTPATQHVLMGNILGDMFDQYSRMNIEAQHQFKHSGNPYIPVYDRANREYNDQMSLFRKSSALEDLYSKRSKPLPQYGSLQQYQNARLAQQTVDILNDIKKKSADLTGIQSINSLYGRPMIEALQNAMKQNNTNDEINANENKAYLNALMELMKEKRSKKNSLINMIALAGKEQKRNDDLYHTYLPNYLEAMRLGIDNNILSSILNFGNNKQGN